jgi:hypothetical protein
VVLVCAAGWARADPWPFVPSTPGEAAMAASSAVVPVRTLRARGSYLDIRDGGSATGLRLHVDLPMKYAWVPGLSIPHLYSIVVAELSVVSLSTPKVTTGGITDLTAYDVAIVRLPHRSALAFGFGMVLPSATSPALGFGKLQLGPALGVAVGATRWLLITLLMENSFSVTGDDSRPPVDVLLVQPIVSVNLPAATYLSFDPVWTFDWNRGGLATIRLDLNVGHAFTRRLVLSAGPDWTVVGNGQNDVRVAVELNYLGW